MYSLKAKDMLKIEKSIWDLCSKKTLWVGNIKDAKQAYIFIENDAIGHGPHRKQYAFYIS